MRAVPPPAAIAISAPTDKPEPEVSSEPDSASLTDEGVVVLLNGEEEGETPSSLVVTCGSPVRGITVAMRAGGIGGAACTTACGGIVGGEAGGMAGGVRAVAENESTFTPRAARSSSRDKMLRRATSAEVAATEGTVMYAVSERSTVADEPVLSALRRRPLLRRGQPSRVISE